MFYIGIPIAIIILVVSLFSSGTEKGVLYSDVVKQFKEKNVIGYSLNLSSGEMHINLKDGSTMHYVTPSAVWIRDDIKQYIDEYNNQNPNMPMVQKY